MFCGSSYAQARGDARAPSRISLTTRCDCSHVARVQLQVEGPEEKRRKAHALQNLADFSGRVGRSTTFVFGTFVYAQARGDTRPPPRGLRTTNAIARTNDASLTLEEKTLASRA